MAVTPCSLNSLYYRYDGSVSAFFAETQIRTFKNFVYIMKEEKDKREIRRKNKRG